MQSRVYSVSILHNDKTGHVAFYRTDGTRTGGGLRIYTITVSRLCRLMRAMVNTACEKRVGMTNIANWTSWWIVGVVEHMREGLDAQLEGMTLG